MQKDFLLKLLNFGREIQPFSLNLVLYVCMELAGVNCYVMFSDEGPDFSLKA